jgi:pimeloyl-ACP methyl ester carboxylesterase
VTTYVLIPGGGGDAWDWHRLAPKLQGRGHDVVPVTLPADDDSAGWNEYADAILKAVGDRTNLVLVAHSLAGSARRSFVSGGPSNSSFSSTR